MSFLINIANKLKMSLDKKTQRRIKKFRSLRLRRLQHFIFCIFFGSNLKLLSTIYGTDKWGFHWYAQHYEKHFASMRKKELNILEIGIGGYSDPESGGDSLRVWRTYFPKSNIYGIDIYDKSIHQERRIKTFLGSQIDEMFLSDVVRKIGKIDIIIDDGSHQNEHILFTFKFLFPYLHENGFYVIEDTQTSYWPELADQAKKWIAIKQQWDF